MRSETSAASAWIRFGIAALLFWPLFSCAQEHGVESMSRFPLGVEESEYRYRYPTGGTVSEVRVEPPFWWVGMRSPELQILIHDEQIGDMEVSLDAYPGVRLKQVDRVANPNYLFLQLAIDPGARPGRLQIRLQGKEQSREYPYELRDRKNSPARLPTLGPSDVIYLLMPDRFANGDPSNDSVLSMHQKGIDRDNVFFRHGGDIQGILDRLDYLDNLGVTAIWPNPVLENDQPYESYHGYAITDFYRIDQRLGTNELYRELVAACHRRGIKVVMDIIFNHVGDQHWFIQDLPAEDWIHQSEEYAQTTYRAPTLMDPHASKADIRLMEEGWFDKHMPDLNQDHPLLAQYLIQSSIWWTEYTGQDGFRVDTYPYPSQAFMSAWCRRLREEFPDLHFFGETWVHGTPIQAQFVEGSGLRTRVESHLPAVTDFQLHYALLESVQESQGWTSGVSRLYYTLAKDFLYEDPYRNVIFLDNHDMSRFFSAVSEDWDRFRSGMILLMSMRGIPVINYGTEIGLTGSGGAFGEGGRLDFPGGWPSDPVNKFVRANLDEQEGRMFDHVQALLRYRKETPTLHRGQLMQFVPQDDVYVFFRYDEEKTILVAYNSGEQSRPVRMDRFRERLQGVGSLYDPLTDSSVPLPEVLMLEPRQAVLLECRP